MNPSVAGRASVADASVSRDYPGLFMSLLTVAVMFLVTEGYGYLTQNTAQTQRDKTTQRSEERKGRNLCALRSSALQIRLGYWGSRIIRVRKHQGFAGTKRFRGHQA